MQLFIDNRYYVRLRCNGRLTSIKYLIVIQQLMAICVLSFRIVSILLEDIYNFLNSISTLLQIHYF